MAYLDKLDLVGVGFLIACIFFIVIYPTTLFISIISLLISCGITSRFLLLFLRFFFSEGHSQGTEKGRINIKKYVVLRFVGTGFSLFIVLTCLFFLFRIPAYITSKTPADLYRFYRISGSLQTSPKEKVKILKAIQKTMGVPPDGATFKTHVQYFFLSLFNLLLFQFGYSSTTPSFRIIYRLLRALPYSLSLLGVYTLLFMMSRLLVYKEREETLYRRATRPVNLPGTSLQSSFYWVVPSFLWLGVLTVEWLFKLPGVGWMFLQAATFPEIDYVTAHVLTYFMAFTALVINLIVDLVCVLFSPTVLKKQGNIQ